MVKIWDIPPRSFINTRMKEYLPDELVSLDWYGGESFKGIFPDGLTMICPRKPLDYFPHAAMRVVSDKIKEILEREQANAEFFRLRVEYRKSVLENYYIVNFLDVVDCLDPERTIYSEEGLSSHCIKRLALKPDPVHGKPLFHIQGTILLGASDSLAEEVTKVGCTGVWFPAPEEWRNPAIPSDYPHNQ